MQIDVIEVGPLNTNCYIVYDREGGSAFIVDPGEDGDVILEEIKKLNLSVEGIINTHGHFDHVMANSFIAKMTAKPIYLNEKDLQMLNHPRLNMFAEAVANDISSYQNIGEGDELKINDEKISVISTPGHTPGGITLHAGKYLLVGDLIFQHSVGRTDLPGGNYSDLISSLKKIITFSEDTIICPGHGPWTTVGRELISNPYLQDLGKE